jgi:hypothetical protein
MPIGERNTRAGFQITFKSDGASLVGKFNNNINGPRTMLRRVGTAACVVLGMVPRNVGREPV